MKIFTVGSKSFVTSFQLAGIPGIISETPEGVNTSSLTILSLTGMIISLAIGMRIRKKLAKKSF